MIKSKLRKIYLAKQQALSKAEIRDLSQQIGFSFFSRFDLSSVRYLHVFLSIRKRGEVDTAVFINELWSNYINVKTVVPRVNFDDEVLEHLEINSDSKLRVSDWGIAEPDGDELIDEKKIDIVLVPLLCFDKRGYRVGYGGGFYDKFLVDCREDCLKIGVSLFDPVEEIEEVKDFDVRLDYCITPEKTWKF